jgi:hypothetical protein
VLLNEILFQPAPGESAFVELANMGAEPATLDGFALANQAGERFTLPAGVTLPAGGLQLVRFDGPQAGFLQRETGSLSLLSGGNATDETLWSTAAGPSFNLGRGGHIPTFVPGTTLGRPRGSTGRGPAAWTVFDPAEATPGAPNPFPSVTGMMPLSGAIVRLSTPTLSWYGVPTATRYRVQVATDRAFTSPVFDGMSTASGSGIASEEITTPALPPGRYLWRVQAMFGSADTQSAAFSRPAILWLESPPRAAARTPLGDWLRLFVAPAFAAQASPPVVHKVLPVPLFLQHKDTSLLSLEGDETGAKPWDRPWPVAKAMYCARASIAMVTAFFHGNLSQDRISYEGDKDWIVGPRRDLNVLGGWEDPAIKRALTFALGSAPRVEFVQSQIDAYLRQKRDVAAIYWAQHTAEIDAKRPILGTTQNHAWVIVGYGEDARGKYFTINDPALGQYDWLFIPVEGVDDADLYAPGNGVMSTSFFLPENARGKSDEPEVSTDSDGDGVMDFDETKRFHTDPQAKDTDGDGVPDKQEIRAWVFDEKFGYWPDHLWGDHSDQDYDKQPMEVDADSDGGGCLDGMEDTNSNGKHDAAQKEFSNFDKNDDDCLSGSYQLVEDTSRNANDETVKIDVRTSIQFSVRNVEGTQKGRAIVTSSSRQQLHSLSPPFNGEVCRDSVDSTEPYQYVVDVQANVVPTPDGTASVSVFPLPVGWRPPMIRHLSTCAGRPAFEREGPGFDLGGVLRNGVFHERIDMPLEDGNTGTRYYETDIRRSRRP